MRGRPPVDISFEDKEKMSVSEDTVFKGMIIINLSLLAVGLIQIVLGIWSLTADDSVWMRTKYDSVPVMSIMGGVMVVVVSLYGLCTRRSAPEDSIQVDSGKISSIETLRRRVRNTESSKNDKNSLICYFNLLLLLLLLQLAVVGILSRDFHTISNYSHFSETKTYTALEQQIISKISEDADKWKQMQDDLRCCGYDAKHPKLSTGKKCSAEPIVYCAPIILTETAEEIEALLILSVVVLVLEIIGMSAAIFLCCSSSDPQDEYFDSGDGHHYGKLSNGAASSVLDGDDDDDLTDLSWA